VPSLAIKQQQQQPFYGPLSGTTRVNRYQKKHSPTHHTDHHPIFISFFHLPRSIASSLFKLRAGNLFAQPLSMSSCHQRTLKTRGWRCFTKHKTHAGRRKGQKCRLLSEVTLTLTFKLDRVRDQNVFHVNLAQIHSVILEILHIHTKKSQTAPKTEPHTVHCAW